MLRLNSNLVLGLKTALALIDFWEFTQNVMFTMLLLKLSCLTCILLSSQDIFYLDPSASPFCNFSFLPGSRWPSSQATHKLYNLGEPNLTSLAGWEVTGSLFLCTIADSSTRHSPRLLTHNVQGLNLLVKVMENVNVGG